MSSEEEICVYPISGPYGYLQRFLFYSLLAFAVTAYRQEWLVRGSVAAAMTYSASACVHAVLLAAVSTKTNRPLDLDVFGVYIIISSAIIVLGPMLDWCKPLRQSAARIILKVWGVLLSVGLVCAFATIWQPYEATMICHRTPLRPKPCVSSDDQDGKELENCDKMHSLPHDRLFGKDFNALRGSAVASFVLMALSLLSVLASRSGDAVVIWEKDQRRFTLRHGYEHEHKEISFNTTKPWLIKIFFGIVAPIAFVANIVAAEIYILRPPRLPTIEDHYAVGQWNAWVGVALILAAAGIAQWEQWLRRRRSRPLLPLRRWYARR
ncbi:MAG: hypothetical protein Q9207_003381 [Kuettlingeria erythrocarpa]